MVQAYNFLASWQLFPEKCSFEHGLAPKNLENQLLDTAAGLLAQSLGKQE